MKLLKSKAGFTLVEMIIVIAVAAIVLTPFGMMMTSGLRNEVKVQRTIDADQTTQQTFIHLNEKIRASGFSSLEIIDNHFGAMNVVRVNNTIYFRNSNGYVSQTYDQAKLVPDSENVVNEYVLGATAKFNDFRSTIDASDHSSYTTEQLDEIVSFEIVFSVDTDNDGIENNSYTFMYAKRR